MTWLEPITLRSDYVTLAPLTHAHRADLAEAVEDGHLWELWYTFVPQPQDVGAEIDRRLRQQGAGSMLPFAVIHNDTGKAVGMTTFMNVDPQSKRVEIGSTWYRKSVQRTALNTHCKRLLLGHAFEALGCIAVELRTHILNRQSRAGIERLGAKLDGILRCHMRMPNGSLRDTAVYSITAAEWPAVCANLDFQLARNRD